jgi:hypothetical protein
LRFDEPTYTTIKRILAQGLDQQQAEQVASLPPARAFVRTVSELVGHLMGE